MSPTGIAGALARRRSLRPTSGSVARLLAGIAAAAMVAVTASSAVAADTGAAETLSPIPLMQLDATPGSLADFSGRVVVVNVWATWCEPCVREMPSLARLARRYADRPLTVVAVSAGDTRDSVRAFLARNPVDVKILLAPERRTLLRAWRIRALPSTFVLDTSGHVRHRFVGERDWEADDVLEMLDTLTPR